MNQILESNRNKSRKARGRATGWCDFCDMAKVGRGERCPVCKNRDKTRTSYRNLFIDKLKVA
jgi:hypothetical protein